MSLLVNAIESIQVGVEDYLMDDSRRYLSAIRNICAGILLLYKEKLCQLSPSHDKEILIKKDIRPRLDDEGNVIFTGEGKKTVDVQEIRNRFDGLGIKVDWKKFEELNRLRNEVEHYYTDKSPDAIREIVARSFILIRDFISEHLKEEPYNLLGNECWQALLNTADVYAAEKEACSVSLKKINWKYQTLQTAVEKIRCPACHSSLIKTESEEEFEASTALTCSSCGENFDFDGIAEQCLSDSLAGEIYTSVKEGDEVPLGNCPACHHRTYLVFEKHCVLCEYEPEYTDCEMCGTPLSLDEQCLDGYCGYCSHKLEKIMAE